MSNSLKIYIVLVAIILAQLAYILYQNNDISKREKENLVSEGRDQIFRELAIKENLKIKALNKIIRGQDSVIAVKEKQLPIIKIERDEKVNSITMLNASEQIKLFSKYTASVDSL